MAGHSKWNNIRIRKGKVDAQRGKLFTKAAREILMAARQGGGDPDANFRLRVAIQRAKDVNMPAVNIERLLEKAAGGADGEGLEEILYEGYGPHGVAVLIEAATDNRNRTAAELRTTFAKGGGNLGESGCVGWLFERQGALQVASARVDEEGLLMAALEAGALDLARAGEDFVVSTRPADLHKVKEALEAARFQVTSAELTLSPKTLVQLDAGEAGAVLRLLESLEDLDDVQQVHANLDLSPELLEALGREE